MSRLKASQIKNAAPGRHSDGDGLILNVSKSGRKTWVYRFQLRGKRRDYGIGSYPAVSLSDARQAAADARKLVKAGTDPIEHRRESMLRQDGVTFETAAVACWEAKCPEWKNAMYRRAWIATLRNHAFDKIGARPVAEIGTPDVLFVIEPIWHDRPRIATALMRRIQAVIDFSVVKGWREPGANPARWSGHLSLALPKSQKVRATVHHSAMPYTELPEFMKLVAKDGSIAAMALMFIVFTAARANEAIGARWSEIDTDQGTWTIPAGRMKGGKAHRVPLTRQTLALLDGLPRINDYLFPGQRGHVHGSTVRRLLHDRLGRDERLHGFRTSFRTWCAERTSFPPAAAEQSLAHAVGSQVERSYQRSDLFEIRRQLMESWSDYLSGHPCQTSLEQPKPEPDQLADLVSELDEDQRQRLLEMLASK